MLFPIAVKVAEQGMSNDDISKNCSIKNVFTQRRIYKYNKVCMKDESMIPTRTSTQQSL